MWVARSASSPALPIRWDHRPLPAGRVVVAPSTRMQSPARSSTSQQRVCPTGSVSRWANRARVWAGSDAPISATWAGPWRAVLDDWLAPIGAKTSKSASFSLGVVGFGVSGCTDASTLAGKMPQTRNVGYLSPQGGALRHGADNT